MSSYCTACGLKLRLGIEVTTSSDGIAKFAFSFLSHAEIVYFTDLYFLFMTISNHYTEH